MNQHGPSPPLLSAVLKSTLFPIDKLISGVGPARTLVRSFVRRGAAGGGAFWLACRASGCSFRGSDHACFAWLWRGRSSYWKRRASETATTVARAATSLVSTGITRSKEGRGSPRRREGAAACRSSRRASSTACSQAWRRTPVIHTVVAAAVVAASVLVEAF